MCNIGTVMHCIGALTVQINAIRIIGHMDWIGFRKLDPRPTLSHSSDYKLFLAHAPE